MAGIALKSAKYVIKCDNGLTSTGRASTRSYSFKGANTEATAESIAAFFDAAFNLGDLAVLTTTLSEEHLVSDDL